MHPTLLLLNGILTIYLYNFKSKNDFFELIIDKNANMNIIKIEKEISFRPDKLSFDKKISNKNIEDIFIEKYTNTCDKKTGYIIEILKINSISEISIHENGFCICRVNASIKRLKPVKNMILSGQVQEAFTHGLFVTTHLLEILIPSYKLKNVGYIYEENSDTDQYYTNKKKLIRKGDDIKYIITNIRYEKNNYSCIGNIKID